MTGGSGDIKPQILTTTAIQPNTGAPVNEYIVKEITLPVPRIGSVKNKATITEILKVWFYTGPATKPDSNVATWATLATSDLNHKTGDSTVGVSPGRQFISDVSFPTALVGNYFNRDEDSATDYTEKMPKQFDLTDSNGNGVLVATDTMYFVVASQDANIGQSFVAKILYRMVDVPIQEYVGIVQSQK